MVKVVSRDGARQFLWWSPLRGVPAYHEWYRHSAALAAFIPSGTSPGHGFSRAVPTALVGESRPAMPQATRGLMAPPGAVPDPTYHCCSFRKDTSEHQGVRACPRTRGKPKLQHHRKELDIQLQHPNTSYPDRRHERTPRVRRPQPKGNGTPGKWT